VKFTEQELAELSGETVEDDSPVLQPGEVEAAPAVEGEEVAEEPTEEPAEEPAVEAEEASEETVSVESLQEQIAKHKKGEAGLLAELIKERRSGKEAREWRQGVQDRLEALTEEVPEEGAEVPEEPAKDDDPVAWLAWKQEQGIKDAMAPMEEKAAQDAEYQQYNDFLKQSSDKAVAYENQYCADNSMEKQEFENRLDDLRFDRMEKYVALGHSPQDAQATVEQEEMRLVLGYMNDGVNPANAVMQLYDEIKPKAHPGREKPVVMENEAPSTLDVVEAARKGQKTEKLSNVSSTGDRHVITHDQFAGMEPDDPIFQKIMDSEKLFAEININGQVNI